MASSTCIQAGTRLLQAVASTVKSEPAISTIMAACAEARRTICASPAPLARAITLKKPMPQAEMMQMMSQLMVVVAPTAAVAAVPSEPTMAVSMYCTAVCMSCSSIVGHASVSTAGSSAGSKPRRGCEVISVTARPPVTEDSKNAPGIRDARANYYNNSSK